MDFDRRTVLSLGATTAAVALAGCGAEPSLQDERAQAGPLEAEPAWYDPVGERPSGAVVAAASIEAAEERFPFEAFPESQGGVRTFVEGTNFRRSTLLYVESVGPDACYVEINFDDIHVEDDRIRCDARATAREAEMCAEVITFPAAILRVSRDGGVPETATVTVEDGWGSRDSFDADGR